MKNVLISFLCLVTFSCSQYLDVKPDKKLVVPSKIRDLEALLNNTRVFNIGYPGMGEVAAADFYLLPANFAALVSPSVRNSYIWTDDIFNENERNEWSMSYNKVYHSNIIINAIESGKIIDGQQDQILNLKGAALFFRAYTFYELLQLFASSYNENLNSNDLGIPLRLSSNFNEKTIRANLSDSYNRVIEDARLALQYVPEQVHSKTMPNKTAVNAFLARVMLTIGKYQEALIYAEQGLKRESTLLNLNTLESSPKFPFSRYNAEVLLHTSINTHSNVYPPAMKVDSILFKSYDENDLRKKFYYQLNQDNSHSFRGSFDGSEILFNGLSVGELFLVAAEASARNGNLNQASQYLNQLLINRYKIGTNPEYTFPSTEVALTTILLERRKELVFRGLRWTDLKRLNKEGKHTVTLTREVEGKKIELHPNDHRYNFLIPKSVIALTNIPQNRR